MFCPWWVREMNRYLIGLLLSVCALALLAGCSKPEDKTPKLDIYYMWDGNKEYAALTLRDIHRTMREGECTFAYDGETLQVANYTMDVTKEDNELIIEKVSNNQYPDIRVNSDLFITSLRSMKWDCGGK